MVFHHRQHGPADSDAGAVERVQEGRTFFALLAVTRIHAARLEVPAVRTGGNLAIGVLARQPDFKVIGALGRETHITGAQQHDAIWQVQKLQDFLRATGHAVELRRALLWRDDGDHLDLLKLVHADHAARVPARRTSFGPETRRKRRHAHRQSRFVMDGVARQIGQRHFCGRDQPAIIGRAEKVIGKFGQLARAEHGFIAHQERRADLGIVMLGRMHIKHELRERTLQTGQRAFQGDKTRTGQFGRLFEIHLAKPLAQINVIARLEVIGFRLAPTAHFSIVRFVCTLRHTVFRQVWQGCQVLIERFTIVTRFLAGFFQNGLEAVDLGAQAIELVLVALGFGTADLLGQGVALGLGFLLSRLGFAHLLVQVDQTTGLRFKRAFRQAGIELGRFFTDQLDIMHGVYPDGGNGLRRL